MEDAHKKAILASSLIKNVISKKIQFEQERKMERGEISESHPVPSSCFARRESDTGVKGSRELLRHASEFHCSSEYAEMCVDELDGSDGSREPVVSSRKQAAAATSRDLELTGEDGIVTRIGTLEAFKSTLLCSQNNAFRCWRDEEVKFQKDRKNNQTVEGRSDDELTGQRYSASGSKTTKMSHLFVPSIQLLSNNGNVPKQQQRISPSANGSGADIKLRSDSTLYIEDSRNVASSKPPEIKINLRSTRGNRSDPSGASKLLSPSAGCTTARFTKADDAKYQVLTAVPRGESTDKVPHFMVRDVRDKGKLQTPIHQVRDVRKLVKSSYHFVPADNSDNKCTFYCSDGQQQQKTRNSVSPIVIKYQSVNTNSNEKTPENIKATKLKQYGTDKLTPEDVKSDPLQREAGSALSHVSNLEESIGLRTENGSKKQEKMLDAKDKKSELKIPNQVALEKLQAAVKTMEQLYVFEKNEWKRKNEPLPLTDSHVLSLITSDDPNVGPEGGGARGHSMDRACSSTAKSSPARMTAPIRESMMKQDDKDQQVPQSVQALRVAEGKATLNLSTGLKSCASVTTPQLKNINQILFDTKNPILDFPKLPVSLQHTQAPIPQSRNEVNESKVVDRFSQEFSSASTDNDNYLTIPVNPRPTNSKQPLSDDKPSLHTFTRTASPGQMGMGIRSQKEHNSGKKLSSIVMETNSGESTSASIYHSLQRGMPPSQPQFYCFSPAVTPALNVDSFQTVERKMLLDPSSGNYYLVDTPVHLTTKRLFDPEVGQYVEVPMSQPPMAPIPIQIPHLALSPGPAYMLYPSFMPTASVMPTQPLVQSTVGSEEQGSSQRTEGVYMDSPIYMTTGNFPQHTPCGIQQPAPTTIRPPRPVISFNPQQGTRIIAPPSFDGTTMSFVVEHR